MLPISKNWHITFLTLLIILLAGFRKKMNNTVSTLKERVGQLLQGRGLKQKEIDSLSDLVARQAYHETGGFKSSIFLDNKNYFGMKASSRDYDKGVLHGHALYNSYDDSIRDLLQYMAERKGGLKSFALPSIEAYAQRLKSLNYFEDSIGNYIKGMKNAK